MEAIDQLSNQLVQYGMAQLQDDKGIHIETLLTLFGAVTGTEMFLRHAADIPAVKNAAPGTAVLIESIDQEGPVLFDILLDAIRKMGVDVKGGVQKIPFEHQPEVPAVELAHRHFYPVMKILNQSSIEDEEKQAVLTVTLGKLISMAVNRTEIASGVALSLVLESIIKCTKVKPAFPDDNGLH